MRTIRVPADSPHRLGCCAGCPASWWPRDGGRWFAAVRKRQRRFYCPRHANVNVRVAPGWRWARVLPDSPPPPLQTEP